MNAFNKSLANLFKGGNNSGKKSKSHDKKPAKKVYFTKVKDEKKQWEEAEHKRKNDEILKALTNLMRMKIETNLKNKKMKESSNSLH